MLAVALLVTAEAPAVAGGRSDHVIRIPVSTASGSDIAEATVAFDYPAGTLSNDFVPPSWAELGPPNQCPASLLLTAPTLGSSIMGLDHVLSREEARIPYVRRAAPPSGVKVRWIVGRVNIGPVPTVQLSAAISVPSELRAAGKVIGIGVFAEVSKRDTLDQRCPSRTLEAAGLARAQAAAVSMIRHLRLYGEKLRATPEKAPMPRRAAQGPRDHPR